LEVGQAEDGFLEGDDFVDGHVGAVLECGVMFKEVPESCDGWDAEDAGLHVCDVK
jgi:hypothetical protein